MVRVRAIVRRRKYFSIAPDEMAALSAVHPYSAGPAPRTGGASTDTARGADSGLTSTDTRVTAAAPALEPAPEELEHLTISSYIGIERDERDEPPLARRSRRE